MPDHVPNDHASDELEDGRSWVIGRKGGRRSFTNAMAESVCLIRGERLLSFCRTKRITMRKGRCPLSRVFIVFAEYPSPS